MLVLPIGKRLFRRVGVCGLAKICPVYLYGIVLGKDGLRP
jgi:hypothetical protein